MFFDTTLVMLVIYALPRKLFVCCCVNRKAQKHKKPDEHNPNPCMPYLGKVHISKQKNIRLHNRKKMGEIPTLSG